MEDVFDADEDQEPNQTNDGFRKKMTKLLALEEKPTLYMRDNEATPPAPSVAQPLKDLKAGKDAGRSRRDSLLTPVYENATAITRGKDGENRRPVSQQNTYKHPGYVKTIQVHHSIGTSPSVHARAAPITLEELAQLGLPPNIDRFKAAHGLMHSRMRSEGSSDPIQTQTTEKKLGFNTLTTEKRQQGSDHYCLYYQEAS